MRAGSLLAFTLLAAVGCGSNNNDGGLHDTVCSTAGWKCATAACAMAPVSMGCDYVAPTNGFCPTDRSTCFDPSKAAGYCDPAKSICARMKTPAVQCKPMPCTVADVEMCMDTNAQLFCANGFACVPFGCGGEDMSMSIPTDGGAPDLMVGGDR